MNRNQLRYFVSAAEHRSFTKAAEQYSRNVRLDRLTLAAGHDLAGAVGCGGMMLLLSFV